jgi:hypothetical protein
MFSDNNFPQFIICIFVIIGVSQTLLKSCSISSNILGICNLFIVLFYPILIYLSYISIKETNKSSDKNTKNARYLLNGLSIVILIIIIIFNLLDIAKFKFKRRKYIFDN